MASNNLNLRRSAHTAGLCILWCVGLQRLNPSLSKEWPSDSVQPTSTRSSRGARAKQYSPVTTQRGWREKKRISCLLLSALLLWDFLLTCAFRQMKGSADLQKSPQYILHCMMINSWLLSSWCLSKSIFYYFLFLFLHTHSLYSLKKILNGWETVYRNFYVFPLFQNLTIFFNFFLCCISVGINRWQCLNIKLFQHYGQHCILHWVCFHNLNCWIPQSLNWKHVTFSCAMDRRPHEIILYIVYIILIWF